MSAETVKALAGALGEQVEAVLAAGSRYPAITPVLYYDDPESVAWIERVFGFEARMKIPGPDGAIVHGELTWDDGLIMIGTSVGSEKWSTPKRLDGAITQSLYVQVEDVDAHHTRVRDAGAQILSEPTDAHGQRRYRVADPEGHVWWFFQDL